MAEGNLRIVGSGMRPRQHLTPEAAEAIAGSEQLLYLIPDQDAAEFIVSLAGGKTIDAGMFYQPDRPLADAYRSMITQVLDWLHEGKQSCFALYGHPGVIVYPSHQLLRSALDRGYDAAMLPAVSAEDCLFADLGIDPANQGCQSFWATDLLLNRRLIDPTMATIVWSIGVVGCLSYSSQGMSAQALQSLLQRLNYFYPPHHEVVVYEAATRAGQTYRADRVALGSLANVPLDGASTLYIPPAWATVPDWQQYAEFQFPTETLSELFQARPPIIRDDQSR